MNYDVCYDQASSIIRAFSCQYSIAYETFNSMKPRDVYGNKWSLFITKMIVYLVVKEQYSLMIISIREI